MTEGKWIPTAEIAWDRWEAKLMQVFVNSTTGERKWMPVPVVDTSNKK